MDLFDMNVLDETENDNGIPAEDDDESDLFQGNSDVLLNEDDIEDLGDESTEPVVRNGYILLFNLWPTIIIS